MPPGWSPGAPDHLCRRRGVSTAGPGWERALSIHSWLWSSASNTCSPAGASARVHARPPAHAHFHTLTREGSERDGGGVAEWKGCEQKGQSEGRRRWEEVRSPMLHRKERGTPLQERQITGKKPQKTDGCYSKKEESGGNNENSTAWI